MSTLPKIGVPVAVLLALALCPRPVYSGSTGIAPVSPPPAATAAPAPPGALPPMTAPSPSSADQMVLRLNRLLTDDLRGAVPVLVIPAQEMTPETYGRIIEDLSIMNRIIEKSTRRMDEVGGIYGTILAEPGDVIYTPRVLRSLGGRPRPIYIGGYGAVFSLAVDFPLLPPPEASEPNKPAEKTDSTWAQAQRELQDPQAALRPQRGPSPGRVYRAEAVETLRNTLVSLLKHATNIRDLGPDAWLTILVQGPAPTARSGSSDSLSPVSVYGARAAYEAGYTSVMPGARGEGRTLLTLRVKKADIDQYAKGQLDDARFQQRVQIATH